MEEDEEDFTGLRNPFVLSPDVNKLLRKNAELKAENETMKRIVPLRSSPMDFGVRTLTADLEEKRLKERYEEAKKLNDQYKDQVDFLAQQLNIIVTVAPPDGDDSGRWDDEGKMLTIVRSTLNTPEQQEVLEKLEKMIEKLRNQVAKAKKKENGLRTRISRIDGFMEEKDMEIENLKIKNENLNSANDALQNELALMKKRRNNERKEMETLKSALSEIEEIGKKSEKELKKNETTTRNLNGEVTQMGEEVKELNRLNAKLKNQIKDLKSRRIEKPIVTSDEIKQKNKRIEELEKENNKKRKEIKGIKSAKVKEEKHAAKTIDDLAKEVATLRDMTSALREGSPLLSPDIMKLSEAANKLQTKLSKEEKLNKMLKEDLRKQIEKSEVQQRQLADEIQAKMQLQVAMRDAKKINIEMEKELNAAQDRERNIASEFESILVLAEEKQKLIKKLQAELEKSKKYVGFLEGGLGQMKREKARDVSSIVGELSAPNSSSLATTTSSKKEKNLANALKARRPQAVSGSKLEKKGTDKISDGIIRRLEKERMNLNEKLQMLHQQLKDQNKFYESEMNSLRDDPNSIRELKDQLDKKEAELGKVRAELDRIREFPSPPRNVIVEEANGLRSKILDLEKQLADQDQNKAELSAELQDSREALLMLHDQLDKVKKLMRKETEAKENAKAALKNLKSQLKKSKEDADEMEERLVLELSSMEKENHRLSRGVVRFEENLERIKSEEMKPVASRVVVEPPRSENQEGSRNLLEEDNQKLREIMQELHNQLKLNQSKLKKLKENLESKSKSIEKMKNSARNNDAKNKSMQIEVERLRNVNGTLVKEMEEMEKLKQEVQGRNTRLQLEVEHLEKNLKLTSQLLEKLQKDRTPPSSSDPPAVDDGTKRRLASFKEKLNEKAEQLNNANDQIQILRVREKNLKSALDDALENVSRLDEKRKKAKADNDDVMDRLKAKLEEKEKEIAEKDEDIKRSKNENKTLNDVISKLPPDVVARASDVTPNDVIHVTSRGAVEPLRPLLFSSPGREPIPQHQPGSLSPNEDVGTTGEQIDSRRFDRGNMRPAKSSSPPLSLQPHLEARQTLEERIRVLEEFHGNDIANLKTKKKELKDRLRSIEDEKLRLKETNAELQQEIEGHESKERDWENRFNELENELEATKIKLEVAKDNVETLKNIRDLALKNKEEKLIETEEKLAECRRTLAQAQARKPSKQNEVTSEERDKLNEELNLQRNKIKNLEDVVKKLSGDVAPVAMKTYFSCRIANIELEYEGKKLKNEVERLRKKLALDENTRDYEQKCPLCDEIKKEVVVVEEEAARLRAELTHFDDYFLNEVEDLRHNYSEAVKLNILYEDQLKDISAKHSIPVNIRTEEVDAQGSIPSNHPTDEVDGQDSIPVNIPTEKADAKDSNPATTGAKGTEADGNKEMS